MTRELAIDDLSFRLDGQPFAYQGLSFFNAIYNPTFNRDRETRRTWLEKFRATGITVLRVWCQWDNQFGYIDTSDDATLYQPNGTLNRGPLERLKQIIVDADEAGIVTQVVLFASESRHIKLAPAAADAAVAAVTRELMPFRSIFLQVWNEASDRVLEHLATIKCVDPQRLVTNSPGHASVLGDEAQNEALDFLTPHTTRRPQPWDTAPRQIADLIARYRKPVVDDEPARNGTPDTARFGGPDAPTAPFDHIVQMDRVWQVGGYSLYHHDMFQTAYGTPPIPPSGIPDPEFSPYHRLCFEFIANRARYCPASPA